VAAHRAASEKLYFKIGEVAELVGVKPHVLRYSETEFPALRPKKTRGAHRHYSRHEVDFAMHLRRLLHDEGYTVPGARRRLRELGLHRRGSPPEVGATREVALRAELLAVRATLAGFLDALDAAPSRLAPSEPVHVTVHQVVQTRAPRRG
jgi:DNA-binding transcriptional MerR regulator